MDESNPSSTSSVPGQDAPYRNPNLPVTQRVDDLLSRMTLAEKAGQMFHNMIVPGPGGTLAESNPAFNLDSTEHALFDKHMTHFNLLGGISDIREICEWHNNLQRRASETRLGIPVTLSTDPRNHFTENVGTAFQAGKLSQWPEPLGLAALGDPKLVERFADVARQEYLALGLRVALHPQIDLATEPRWSRIGATFGEDAELTSRLVEAYVRGFQGGSSGGEKGQLGKESVATMVKHFPGGGPQKDGEDPHFRYGREQIYPGDNWEYHMSPFKAAIEAGASQMMPYYGMPVGTEHEEVGFAFNKSVITGLLRGRLGFKGIICTDWGLVTDTAILGQDMPARAWGCESLSEAEKVKKILDAGCDQFGGESRPELIIELVENGKVNETRIDESVRLLLHEKFVLGLFDNPIVDVDRALAVVGRSDFQAAGDDAQRRSYTLLTNRGDILPLRLGMQQLPKVYVEGMDTTAVTKHGFEVVEKPESAELALLRLKAPYEPRPGGFEAFFHAGSLEFSQKEKDRQAKIFSAVPTVVDIYLDRPAIIPEIASSAAALLASYGSSVDAFLDVILGQSRPEGKLPFDLPSSTKAIEESHSDVPYNTKDPVFRFSDGLKYSG